VSGRLDGKRVLVTGAGGGIGAAITQRFLAEGARVSAGDLSADGGAALVDAGARFEVLDVADPAAVETWTAESIRELGGADVVVAAAGYEVVADALELELDQWDRHIDVMLRGVYLSFRAALPAMIEQGGGSLIAIGSNLSFAGLPRFTSYTAAKHGVLGLVRTMAGDFAMRGVRVNALCPGPTWTPMIERQLQGVPDPAALLASWESDTMFNRLGRPEEIAAGAVFLASDEASFVTGSALMVDGGYTAR
jgi:NAD(P)-dependent dehydrogenase (short-subunit alcohol dehydrogenase family)